MSGLFFLLFFLSVTALILFERIFIVIRRGERFEIEIHFVFFSLFLREKKRKKDKKNLPTASDIFSSVLRLCRVSEVYIKRLHLTSENRSARYQLPTWQYDALRYALLAFVHNNSRSLSVNEDAFSRENRNSATSLDVNIHAYFIDLLVAVTPLLLSLIKNKRKENKYVREQNE